MPLDLVIRNALLLDGTGAPARLADLGLAGERIAAVEPGGIAAGDTPVLEAGGLVLAPGFIDIHTHSDATLLADGAAESQLLQGVTTEIIGNCGHSCAPATRPERVAERIFGRGRDFRIGWRGFGEYLDTLEAARPALNVAALVGHGTLRLCTMEDPGRPASEEEIRGLRRLAREALEEGAIGVSTGLEYAPGSAASPREIVELCREAAALGAIHATHVRNRDVFWEIGLGEALAAARQSGVRTQISHISPKCGAPPGTAAAMVEMIGWSRASGADVAFDVIPHNWGPTTMSAVLPAWAQAGGVARILERLRDPAARARIQANPEPMWRLVADRRWDDIVLFHAPANAGLAGLTLAEIGRMRGVDPYDAVLDLLAEEGEGLFAATWLARQFSDADQELLLSRPECGVISDTVTLSRGGVLAGMRWSPSTWGWTARFLDEFVRGRALMSLAEGVRRLTTLAAGRMGLAGRGVLAPGAFADLVLFDPARLADRTSLAVPEAPPGGVAHVFVNGVLAVRDGRLTGARAGRVLRRASSADRGPAPRTPA
jgi:N-acyl-D-aspartate/D-glutamate deacylase